MRNRRFHLRLPNLHMSCKDLTVRQGTRIVSGIVTMGYALLKTISLVTCLARVLNVKIEYHLALCVLWYSQAESLSFLVFQLRCY